MKATCRALLFASAAMSMLIPPSQAQPASEISAESVVNNSQETSKISRSITVMTPGFYAFPSPPNFCLLSSCHSPSIGLGVSYLEAPDLAKKLRDAMLDKYFYMADPVDAATFKKYSQHISVKTVYFGSVEGYKVQLAKNSAATEAKDAQEKAAALVGVVTYLVTRGSVQSQDSEQLRKRVVSQKEASDLPAGVKSLLVTRIELLNMYNGNRQLENHEETLTAAYDDVSEMQLRTLNYEQGIKRILKLTN